MLPSSTALKGNFASDAVAFVSSVAPLLGVSDAASGLRVERRIENAFGERVTLAQMMGSIPFSSHTNVDVTRDGRVFGLTTRLRPTSTRRFETQYRWSTPTRRLRSSRRSRSRRRTFGATSLSEPRSGSPRPTAAIFGVAASLQRDPVAPMGDHRRRALRAGRRRAAPTWPCTLAGQASSFRIPSCRAATPR